MIVLSRRVATPLLDGLFLLLCWLLLIVNPAQSENAKPIADYVLIVAWDMGRPTDIDVYVQGPDLRVVWYRDKDAGYMSVDRDDLGRVRDNGPINQEVVSLREPPDGSYLITIHTYRDPVAEPGHVALLLQHRSGTVVWHAELPMPPNDAEVGVVELVFVEHMFRKSYPSTALIRHAARRGP